MSGTFEVADVAGLLKRRSAAAIQPNPLQSIVVKSVTKLAIRSLPGYNNRLEIYDTRSDKTAAFWITVAGPDVVDEKGTAFSRIKEAYGFARNGIVEDASKSGEGSFGFNCDGFDYSLVVDQDEDEPEKMKWTRTIRGISNPSRIRGREAEAAFLGSAWYVVLPFKKEPDLVGIIDYLEGGENAPTGFGLDDYPADNSFVFLSLNQPKAKVEIRRKSLVVRGGPHLFVPAAVALFEAAFKVLNGSPLGPLVFR